MTITRKSLHMLRNLLLLFIIAASVNALAPNVFLMRNMSTIVLFAMALHLLLYFSEKILDNKIRHQLMAVAGMILFWVILRGAKYIAFEETEWVARHIWYMYYIPLLLVPLISLHAALEAGTRDNRKNMVHQNPNKKNPDSQNEKGKKSQKQRIGQRQIRKKHQIRQKQQIKQKQQIRQEQQIRREQQIRFIRIMADVITSVLVVMVLTNDSHWCVFRFQPGYRNWDAQYDRGFGFFVVYIWMLILLAAFVGVLFQSCRLSDSRKMIWVPLLPVLFGNVYLVLYALGWWIRIKGEMFGEFPEAMCFMMAGVWLGMITIGFIPSNEGYEVLFEASNLAAGITDGHGKLIYCSKNAAEIEQVMLRHNVIANKEKIESEMPRNGKIITWTEGKEKVKSIRIHRKHIHGGYVYWHDDITELNEISQKLEEIREELEEEASIIRLENHMREEKKQIEAKNRVYDGIAEQVLLQSDKINCLCEELQSNKADFRHNMQVVCLLGTYIKRYANLSLMAAEQDYMEAGELLPAVSESLRCIKAMQIPVNVVNYKNKEIKNEKIRNAISGIDCRGSGDAKTVIRNIS